MLEQNSKLDKVKKVLELVGQDYATTKDVGRILEALGKSVREVKKDLQEQSARDSALLSARVQSALAELERVEERVDKALNAAKKEQKKELESAIDVVFSELRRIEDSIPDSPDLSWIERAIQEVRENIPETLTAEDILDMLDLSVEDIKGLPEALKKLEKRPASGGASALDVSHWPRHEKFTMNGSDTTVTLAAAPACAGDAIFAVRYQGQVLDKTTHYTVDGTKVTLVGFTPETDTVISVSYMP